MNNQNVVNAEIVNGISKKGKKFKALKFTILTDVGLYQSGLVFPTPFEWSAIERALSPLNEIYSNDKQ